MSEKFVDAREMHRNHPKTFHVPSPQETAALTAGDFAKICADPERFWVLITARDGEYLRGVIDNDLLRTHVHGLKLGDEVVFEERHVYAVAPRTAEAHR